MKLFFSNYYNSAIIAALFLLLITIKIKFYTASFHKYRFMMFQSH